MVQRNKHIGKIKASYLFPEINARKQQYLEKYPNAKLISLGIGNTTQPLPLQVAQAMSEVAQGLGTRAGYSGYGAEQGDINLRKQIVEVFYKGLVTADDVFISDGSKCDIGRLQLLFGAEVSIAVQDPTYPVYVDGSVMVGASGSYDRQRNNYSGISYMPCTPENQFFPDLKRVPRTDLIYFCSPNNPTGTVASRQQLKELVAFARANRSIIIFDAAYAAFIQDPEYPKTIFEIEGADEVALETNSFSKIAGFTGVRLGWTIVPEKLKFDDGSSVRADWYRLISTLFNGASNIAQRGGMAVLEDSGRKAIQKVIHFYQENARLLKEAIGVRYQVFGGVNAPYLWVHFPLRKSWDMFQEFLEKKHIVTTPGAGYGPSGEGFLRLSAFGDREEILEVVDRLAEG